jgi:hypothetical protein
VAIPLSKEVSELKSSLRFIYFYCNELNKVRTFYSELIQLHEIYFEDHASVAYQCDQLQFSFSQITEKLPVHDGWATQPGWQGGELPVPSWSIECEEHAFKKVVERLQKSKVESFHQHPVWIGYWSYPVKDPAGNTVEITWPGDEDALKSSI